MLDMKLIRNDFETATKELEKRGVNREEIARLQENDIKRRELIQESEQLKNERNQVTKEIADKNCYETFLIPNDVGGRYSVLTPVGLLPIAVAGIGVLVWSRRRVS